MEPDFYAMPYLPNNEQREVVQVPNAAQYESTASLVQGLASSHGGRLHQSSVFDVPLMPNTESAMHALAQSHMLQSEVNLASLSMFALRSAAAQRTRLSPAALAEAMIRMQYAVPAFPPVDALSIAGIQQFLANSQGAVNHASVESYIRHGGQDQGLAALFLFNNGLCR